MRTIKECKAMMASENWKDTLKLRTQAHEILPELIRVIELAEDAIFQLLKEHDNQSEQWASEALSEIRKLRGE